MAPFAIIRDVSLFMSQYSGDIAAVAKPAVSPIGDHVDVAGDVLVWDTVKLSSDDSCCLIYRQTGLPCYLLPEQIVRNLADSILLKW